MYYHIRSLHSDIRTTADCNPNIRSLQTWRVVDPVTLSLALFDKHVPSLQLHSSVFGILSLSAVSALVLFGRIRFPRTGTTTVNSSIKINHAPDAIVRLSFR